MTPSGELGSADAGADGKRTAKNRWRPILIAAIGGLGLFAFSMSQSAPSEAGAERPPLSPNDLFGDGATCNRSLEASPRQRGETAEALGRAAWERAFFHRAGKVAAVKLLEEAALCFKEAGDEARSEELSKVSQEWREGVWSEFQNHRLRLQVFREQGEAASAWVELTALEELWGSRGGAFAQWLAKERADQSKLDKEEGLTKPR